MENVFERASRELDGLRFPSVKGLRPIHELWTIPLTSVNGFSVNDIGKEVKAQLKELSADSEDLVRMDKVSDKVRVLEIKLEVILKVIEIRVSENKAQAELKANRKHNARIAELIEEKEAEELKGKTIAELKAMMN